MSTGSASTDDWTNGSARGRQGAPRDAPEPSLVAELVLRELLEAEEALTERDLRERTLLPDAEVRQALSELGSRDLCAVRPGRTDGEPRRYVATFPSAPEV